MNLYYSDSRKIIYLTGSQDLRDLNRVLTTYENMDILEEITVISGPSIPVNIEDTYDYTIDLDDENTKNINFA